MHSLKFNFTRFAFACLLLTVGFTSTASAVTSRFQILLNLDNQTNTGCDVPTLTGTFDGVERILITTVDTTGSSASVTAVETQTCVNPATDTFGPPTPIITPPGRPLPWPVGVSNGTGGTSVIETFFPLTGVPMGPSANIRLGVLGFNSGGTLVDEMLKRQPGPGNGPPILMQIQGAPVGEIPTLSEWGLILLALLLAGMAVVLMKRRTRAAFLVALLLLGGAGLAWAAACDLDGTTLGEWNPSFLLAEEPTSDAPTGADIRALYGCRDTGLNGLCFRIDALLLFNQNPTANDQNVATNEDVPVGITLTGSDPDGNPLTFTVLTNPTNGVLSGTAPNLTYTPNPDFNGSDSFTFQVDDGQGGTDTGTVTITVNGADDPPTAVNDVASVLEDAPATAIPVLANDTDPDAGPISIQSVTQPANGTVVITGGGTGLTYQPNPNYCNMPPGTTLDTFTYTLTPASAMPTATVTVTVDCVNDPPVANNDAATVTEDDPATAIPVLANDTDTEGDPFTIQSVTQPANGTVTLTPVGPGPYTGLTYTPNPDYCNNPPGTTLDTFTYTLMPGGASATVTMTVTCVNDNPVAVADSATVAEDSSATAVPVLANDTDAENDPFTILSVTQPTNGTVVITGGGTGLTYQANPDYCNAPPGTTLDTFTYTLTPGGSSTTVTMTVTCVDDNPVAVADAATVAEDSGATAVPVLANDTDVDAGPISITSVTQPANGTVVITGGGTGLTYAPNANYCNTPPGTTLDTFTYTLTPGGSSTTVTMTVTCADDNPVAVPDAATVAEDSGATAVPVLANDTDPDGGPISISAVTQPANGTVVITGGGTGLTYQPNPNYCGPDTFTYTLAPGGSTATVTMTVTCVDDDPVAVADAATVAEDSGANPIPVLANDTDVDGGPISISAVTQPANGTVVITGGGTGLTYQPNPNYCGPDTFIYTLTPGGSTATVTMTVTCGDDPPVAVNDAATVAEDSGPNAIPVLANDTDVDGGPISISGVTQPANGTVVITGGGTGLTYQPNPNYCNSVSGVPDTFTYTLTPGGSSATVSVTVTCLNDGPVLDLDADDSQGTTGSDFAVTFTEGNPATLIEDPTDATITDIDSATLASLTVTLTNLFDTGNEILSTDVTGTSITATYVTVPGTPGTGTLTLTGPDTVANFQTVLRKVRYLNTSNAPDTTARVIQFVANDGTTNSNTATSTVTVISVDTDPTAVADSATVAEDSVNNAINVLANDTDPDGGPISIQSVTQPANGTVALTPAGPGPYTGLTYTPNPNYCNSVSGVPDTFMYTLMPGGSSATVSVTVTCADDNPVAVPDAATVVEDSGPNAIPVLANDTDPDGGPISITSVTQPANGTVVITGGGTGLTYAPNPNYCNSVSGVPDTFTYTLTPGGSTATVTVTVTCVDDNPVAVADAATVIEDSVNNAINVLANDTDVDGGPISITSVTQPANGAVVITGGGTGVTYTPNPNYCNTPPGTTPDTFTYTLTPGGSSTTVSVAVTCVDDPPTAVADSATVVEDSGANAIPVLANDTDPDGGPISITSVTQPANGTVVITGGGTGLTYAPNANYCNSLLGPLDTFMYTLTPGGSTTTVTMTVTCVNDPPVADNDTFDFIGNTELRVDLAAASTPHALETTPSTFGVIDGDSDPVENDAISVTGIVGCADITAPFVCVIAGVGTVTMESNGRFSFVPAPGDAGATETFQYIVTDDGEPAPASTTATVTLTRFERVWYVKNDAPAGGNGTSIAPFNSITAANLSDNDGDGDLTDDLDVAGDYIFVYFGNGTAANQSGGLVLENNQHLIGEHAGLSLNVNLNGNGAPTNLVAPAVGSRPLLDDTVVDAFEGVSARNVIPAEIVGMNLAGNVNAIDWTTTAAFAGTGTLSIRDNVVRSATNEGVDINLVGTGATRLAFHDNTLTAAGTGLDIQETGTGALTITAFANNVVTGNTGGSGIFIMNATFDSVPGGTLDAVSGGTTVIGASGNPAGTNLTHGALWMDQVTGSLSFTDLDIFAAGFGLAVVGTGPFTGATGTSIQVIAAPPDNTGTSTLVANDGAAVGISNATVDLRLAQLTSTPTTFSTSGVDFVNVAGQFRAPSGSSITKGSGIGQAFGIDNSAAGTTVLTSVYNGTINNSSATARAIRINNADSGSSATFTGSVTETGQGVSLTNNTGATISLRGGLTASTGANPAFTATGGGTLEVCDENPCNPGAAGLLVNTLTTTSGTALNVANTTISANDLEFRSISANGATNGILLNTTGALGELNVKGNGGAGTGGTIQNTTGDGISLASTRTPSFNSMNILNTGGHGINSNGLTAGFTVSGCQIIGAGNGDNEHGINVDNTGGTVTVQGSTLTDAEESLIDVDNNNTNLTLNFGTALANTFTHGTVGAFTGNAVLLVGRGSTSYTVNVSNNQFNNIFGTAVQVGGDGTSTGTHNITIDNNDTDVTVGGPSFRSSNFNVQARNTSVVNIFMTNNDMNGGGGGSLQVGADDSSNVEATITGNVVYGGQRADGILAGVDKSAKLRLLIQNNSITNVSSDGMEIANFDADGGTPSELDAVIENNTVTNHNTNTAANAFIAGIGVFSFGGPTCVKITGNNVQGTPSPGTFFDYSLEELGGTMTFEEVPNIAGVTAVTADYILDGGAPDVVDTTPPNMGGSNTLDLVGTIDTSNGVVVCDRP